MPTKLHNALNAIRASQVRLRQTLPPLEITEPAVYAQEVSHSERFGMLVNENAQLRARIEALERETQLADAASTCILAQNSELTRRIQDLEIVLENVLDKHGNFETQTNKRISQLEKQHTQLEKQHAENAANLKEHALSVDERFKKVVVQPVSQDPAPSPPIGPRRAVLSLRTQRVAEATDLVQQDKLSLAKVFRDKMTALLKCRLSKQISPDPVVSFDGFVVDRHAIDKHYESNVSSPFSGAIQKSGGIECSAVTAVCELLLDYKDRNDAGSLIEMYKQMKRIVNKTLSQDEYANVTSSGHICTYSQIMAAKRGVCPVTHQAWDGEYVLSQQLTDMCKLIQFNARLAE